MPVKPEDLAPEASHKQTTWVGSQVILRRPVLAGVYVWQLLQGVPNPFAMLQY